MSNTYSNKKSRLADFKLFYENIPIPDIDPNRDLIDTDKPSSRAPRNKRVSRPRR